MRYAGVLSLCAVLAVPFGFVGAMSAREARQQDEVRRHDTISRVTINREGMPSLRDSILDFVVEKNPHARLASFREFPDILLAEAAQTNIDHCLALAQAAAESDFRPDAVGAAGEIGLFQMLPSTAAVMEPVVGKFRRPSFRKYDRDLGDLADPNVSTRFAMAYLRDILKRKPNVRDALTEYNGGPKARHPQYYRTVMAAYVETLERPTLRCRFQEVPRTVPTVQRPQIVFVKS
jgi:soluble lytic murein transglycosylase-like protein